jgi:hypothetical protein
MPAADTIHYVQQSAIDRIQWDACINQAENGLIYGYAAYLDGMADNWDALILNDYQAVMPLPWRKKLGIYYLYQPFLTAQLGLFGNELTPALLEAFLKNIPSKFRLWEFPLNHGNRFKIPGYHLYERMNYVLPLNRPYADLEKQYRDNHRRNIKKAMQYGCIEKSDAGIERILSLAKEQDENIAGSDLKKFEQVYQAFESTGRAKSYGIFAKDESLLASAAFLFSHQRAYYILVGNHPNGRTLGASHALVDYFIRDHAGQDLILDFEGSDIRNLAYFYSSFGAQEEPYVAIKQNRLPFYARWVKR